MSKFQEYLKNISEATDFSKPPKGAAGYNKFSEFIDELEEVKETISQAINEAARILREAEKAGASRMIMKRAESYWMAHIASALDKESGYLGGSMTTLDDTIRELKKSKDEDDEE